MATAGGKEEVRDPVRKRVRKPPDPEVSGTLSIKEASAKLGIGTSTGYDLANRGKFPVRIVVIGSTRKILKADMDRFLEGLAAQAG